MPQHNGELRETGFARLAPAKARLILVALVACTLAAVVVTQSRYRISFTDRKFKGSDFDLYWAEVERMRGGESYYEAAATELPARGYPTGSVFNWRMPLPMWLIAHLPTPIYGKWILSLCALALLLIATLLMAKLHSVWQAAVCAIAMAGAVLPCLLGKVYISPGLWASILIGLSICAYGLEKPAVAVSLGLAAAFFRELAVGYCLVMGALAVWQRRRVEAVAWVAGLAAFGAFFAWHWTAVQRHAPAVNAVEPSSWVQFNGPAFLIACTQMNGFLLLLPQWVSAVYLCLAVLGLAGWKTEFGVRVAVAVGFYLAAFTLVGQEVNQYWGETFAPLLALGAARAPRAVWDLLRSTRTPA